MTVWPGLGSVAVTCTAKELPSSTDCVQWRQHRWLIGRTRPSTAGSVLRVAPSRSGHASFSSARTAPHSLTIPGEPTRQRTQHRLPPATKEPRHGGDDSQISGACLRGITQGFLGPPACCVKPTSSDCVDSPRSLPGDRCARSLASVAHELRSTDELAVVEQALINFPRSAVRSGFEPADEPVERRRALFGGDG